MDYQLAQSHTLLKYISSSSGTVNCSSFPPFLLVTLISLALCRARALAYCIRVGQLPLDVQAAFGTLAPSVGHGRRVCRILRSETLRQARILRDFLYVQVDRGPGDRSARVKKRHEWTKLIDHAVESRWKQELLLLRRQKRRPQVRSAGQLHVEEGISLPDYVRTTLSLGPKFAVEKKNSPAELLSLVRNVSRAAPDSESERCVSEGVDVLYRYAPRGKTIPVRKVVSYLKSNKLCLLPSDKEGGFCVVRNRTFMSKGHAAIDSVFNLCPQINLKDAKRKACNMLDKLNLCSLVRSVNKQERLALNLFFFCKDA
ncbi:uncharacterized protein LOC142786855 [Rhipicephalus microplus]|uniref:uncharacterized protein LOC142786855 n=1 Tax=Rhipicephalus microplus TaxID=6941 RepID=UPI003F6C92F2